MTTIALVSVSSFLSGVALMYLVMSRTHNKRRLERMAEGRDD
jgi:CHASE1-domain containing sensor protein